MSDQIEARIVGAAIDYSTVKENGRPVGEIYLDTDGGGRLIHRVPLPVGDLDVGPNGLASLALICGYDRDELAKMIAYAWAPTPVSRVERLFARLRTKMHGLACRLAWTGTQHDIHWVERSLHDIETTEATMVGPTEAAQ